ncbi:Transposase [Streptococcus infantarius subsp. infantarius]|nr:IS256 family transposase [Streptococcus thermophilus]MCO4551905.1 Transposase [Streptococcus infantarius subsp. infantarius]CCC19738.1 transposase [Streptococcus thermophilus JIM 8232]
MTQFTTELLNFLAQKQDSDEFFRTSLETAMNDLLQAELSAFLGYEPYDKLGYNSGNSRNGSYARKFETKYGTVQLSIPRDRNGNFSPALLPAYGRRDDHLEEMVIKLYQTGVRLEKLVISSSECMGITIVLPQFLISQKQLRRMSLLFMSEA